MLMNIKLKLWEQLEMKLICKIDLIALKSNIWPFGYLGAKFHYAFKCYYRKRVIEDGDTCSHSDRCVMILGSAWEFR